MEKGQLPIFEELALADTEDSTAKPAAKFTGTDNPRHLRALNALIARAMPREHLDRAAGCSNGPELVAELRRRGLELPCARIADHDRDGRPIRRGVYHATDADRRKISSWQQARGRA